MFLKTQDPGVPQGACLSDPPLAKPATSEGKGLQRERPVRKRTPVHLFSVSGLKVTSPLSSQSPPVFRNLRERSGQKASRREAPPQLRGGRAPGRGLPALCRRPGRASAGFLRSPARGRALCGAARPKGAPPSFSRAWLSASAGPRSAPAKTPRGPGLGDAHRARVCRPGGPGRTPRPRRASCCSERLPSSRAGISSLQIRGDRRRREARPLHSQRPLQPKPNPIPVRSDRRPAAQAPLPALPPPSAHNKR